MAIRPIMFILALITLASSACLNANQVDGQCTACAPLEVLLSGTCYAKIRGCLEYGLPGPVCQVCQNGYVLSQGQCIRQALITNTTDPALIPSVVVEPPTSLNFSDIQTSVGPALSYQFANVFDQLAQQNPEFISGTISSVKILTTKKGTFLIMVCSSIRNNYETVYFLNKKKQLSKIYVRSLDPQSKDPQTADSQIQKNLGINLLGYELYDVQFANGNTYTFVYLRPYSNLAYQIQFDVNHMGDSLGRYLIIKTGVAGYD